MSKGLGIAAFVITLLSIGIPIVGSYFCFLGLLLAAMSAAGGNRVWPVVVSVIGAVNLFLMSPSWAIIMYSETVSGRGGLPLHTMESTYNGAFYFTWFMVLLPLGVMAYRSKVGTRQPPAEPPTDATL